MFVSLIMERSGFRRLLRRGMCCLAFVGLIGATRGEQPVRILALGDSITEGGAGFCSYRFALWEMLVGRGYVVEYVGSRESPARIGPLRHEGYSGKPVEFLAGRIDEIYRKNPADLVLLHAGHNHTVEEKPVPGIVQATQRIVDRLRAINPRVTILLAQVIPSGKTPKYEYLPELNRALADLVAQERGGENGASRLVLVDQSSGFDWQADTVADHVHPNEQGARKIAARWFEALVDVLPPPARPIPAPEIVVYKRVGATELTLHVFRPEETSGSAPAIVFFFGGGWQNGTPLQFYRECAALAARGMVAITADYRIASVHGTTPFESLADAKAAIRWIRAQAATFGIDPQRVAAAGASAGGHLAAAAAFVPGFDEQAAAERSVSCRPNALVLLYPVIDNSAGGYGHTRLGEHWHAFSPLEQVKAPAPPTILFLGTADPYLSTAAARRFQRRIQEADGRCELRLYPGGGHPLWSYRSGESDLSREVLVEVEAFSRSIGYLRE